MIENLTANKIYRLVAFQFNPSKFPKRNRTADEILISIASLIEKLHDRSMHLTKTLENYDDDSEFINALLSFDLGICDNEPFLSQTIIYAYDHFKAIFSAIDGAIAAEAINSKDFRHFKTVIALLREEIPHFIRRWSQMDASAPTGAMPALSLWAALRANMASHCVRLALFATSRKEEMQHSFCLPEAQQILKNREVVSQKLYDYLVNLIMA